MRRFGRRRPFDVVLAADRVYDPALAPPFAAVVDQAVARGADVVLANAVRNPDREPGAGGAGFDFRGPRLCSGAAPRAGARRRAPRRSRPGGCGSGAWSAGALLRYNAAEKRTITRCWHLACM